LEDETIGNPKTWVSNRLTPFNNPEDERIEWRRYYQTVEYTPVCLCSTSQFSYDDLISLTARK
jgi:hypothetical protein